MIKEPKYGFFEHTPCEWSWRLTPSKKEVTFLVPTAPSAFHRWMQRVCLGIVWERLGSKEDSK
jgi:hypothetical protein